MQQNLLLMIAIRTSIGGLLWVLSISTVTFIIVLVTLALHKHNEKKREKIGRAGFLFCSFLDGWMVDG